VRRLYKAFCLSFLFAVIALVAKPQIITTVAGNGTAGYSGDNGPATSAQLNDPMGVSADKNGNFFIVDRNNNVIRKVNSSGIITTFAGTGIAGYSGDSGLAINAQLNHPFGVLADNAGNVYISDPVNARVRKVNASGIITTFAGNGIYGYSGDFGPAINANIRGAVGLAIDTFGNVFIADRDTSVIRKVDKNGIITTFAGTSIPGYSGNGGPATSAQLAGPIGLATDIAGNVYIADGVEYVIRKVDLSGTITTFAGNHTWGNTGDNGPATSAQLVDPTGIAVDSIGNVYIGDVGGAGERIRVVNNSNVISAFAGNGTYGYVGDNGPAINAEFRGPYSLTFAPMGRGNLYIADEGNNVIRLVTMTTGIEKLAANSTAINIYPNPASTGITISGYELSGYSQIQIKDLLGNEVITEKLEIKSPLVQVDISSLKEGIYFISVNNNQESCTKKLFINH
jgi:hypothetical protein